MKTSAVRFPVGVLSGLSRVSVVEVCDSAPPESVLDQLPGAKSPVKSTIAAPGWTALARKPRTATVRPQEFIQAEIGTLRENFKHRLLDLDFPRTVLILRPFPMGGHFNQPRIKLSQDLNQIRLRRHYLMDILVNHRHFIQSG